ncbi:MAG: transposase [Parcubacteria group bacterium]|nr:transposase [Parcubacteria group bacterium]
MTQAISFQVGNFYHIHNRGADNRSIFTEPVDYERFTALLYAANDTAPLDMTRFLEERRPRPDAFSTPRSEQLVNIGAYSLMPNHFHLLLHEEKAGGISAFMHKLKTAYVMYFNARNRRRGTLFEGRFRGRHILEDKDLERIFAFIHLNPIRLIDPTWESEGIRDIEHAKDFIDRYPHSSYQDYIGVSRPQSSILNRNLELWRDTFNKFTDFRDFLASWLH